MNRFLYLATLFLTQGLPEDMLAKSTAVLYGNDCAALGSLRDPSHPSLRYSSNLFNPPVIEDFKATLPPAILDTSKTSITDHIMQLSDKSISSSVVNMPASLAKNASNFKAIPTNDEYVNLNTLNTNNPLENNPLENNRLENNQVASIDAAQISNLLSRLALNRGNLVKIQEKLQEFDARLGITKLTKKTRKHLINKLVKELDLKITKQELESLYNFLTQLNNKQIHQFFDIYESIMKQYSIESEKQSESAQEQYRTSLKGLIAAKQEQIRLVNSMKKVSSANDDVIEELAKTKEEKSSLETIVSGLRREITGLQDALKQANESHKNTLSQALPQDVKNTPSRQNLDSASSDVAQLTQKDLQQKLATLEETKTKQEAELFRLKEELTQSKVDLSALQTRLETVSSKDEIIASDQAQILELQTKITNATAKITELQDVVAAKDSEKVTLERSLTALQAEKQELLEAKERQFVQQSKAVQKSQKLEKRIQELEQSNQELQAERDRLIAAFVKEPVSAQASPARGSQGAQAASTSPVEHAVPPIDLKTLSDKIDSLNQEIEKNKAEIEKANKNREQALAKLVAQNKANRDLQARISSLETEVQETRKMNTSLTKQLEALQSSRQLDQATAAASQEKDLIIAQLEQKIETQAAYYQQEVNRYAAQLQEKDDNLEDYTRHSTQTIRGLEAEIADKTRELDALKASLERDQALQTKPETSLETIRGLEAEIADKNRELDALKRENEELTQNRIDLSDLNMSLRHANSTMQGELARLKDQSSIWVSEKERMDAELKAVQTALEALQAEKTAMSKELEKHKSQFDEVVRARIEHVKKDLEATKARESELSSKNMSQMAQINRLTQENKDLQKALEAMHTNLAYAEFDKKKALDAERKALDAERQAFDEERKAWLEAKARMEQEISTKNALIAELTAPSPIADTVLDTHTLALRDENQSLRAQLHDMRNNSTQELLAAAQAHMSTAPEVSVEYTALKAENASLSAQKQSLEDTNAQLRQEIDSMQAKLQILESRIEQEKSDRDRKVQALYDDEARVRLEAERAIEDSKKFAQTAIEEKNAEIAFAISQQQTLRERLESLPRVEGDDQAIDPQTQELIKQLEANTTEIKRLEAEKTNLEADYAQQITDITQQSKEREQAFKAELEVMKVEWEAEKANLLSIVEKANRKAEQTIMQLSQARIEANVYRETEADQHTREQLVVATDKKTVVQNTDMLLKNQTRRDLLRARNAYDASQMKLMAAQAELMALQEQIEKLNKEDRCFESLFEMETQTTPYASPARNRFTGSDRVDLNTQTSPHASPGRNRFTGVDRVEGTQTSPYASLARVEDQFKKLQDQATSPLTGDSRDSDGSQYGMPEGTPAKEIVTAEAACSPMYGGTAGLVVSPPPMLADTSVLDHASPPPRRPSQASSPNAKTIENLRARSVEVQEKIAKLQLENLLNENEVLKEEVVLLRNKIEELNSQYPLTKYESIGRESSLGNVTRVYGNSESIFKEEDIIKHIEPILNDTSLLNTPNRQEIMALQTLLKDLNVDISIMINDNEINIDNEDHVKIICYIQKIVEFKSALTNGIFNWMKDYLKRSGKKWSDMIQKISDEEKTEQQNKYQQMKTLVSFLPEQWQQTLVLDANKEELIKHTTTEIEKMIDNYLRILDCPEVINSWDDSDIYEFVFPQMLVQIKHTKCVGELSGLYTQQRCINPIFSILFKELRDNIDGKSGIDSVPNEFLNKFFALNMSTIASDDLVSQKNAIYDLIIRTSDGKSIIHEFLAILFDYYQSVPLIPNQTLFDDNIIETLFPLQSSREVDNENNELKEKLLTLFKQTDTNNYHLIMRNGNLHFSEFSRLEKIAVHRTNRLQADLEQSLDPIFQNLLIQLRRNGNYIPLFDYLNQQKPGDKALLISILDERERGVIKSMEALAERNVISVEQSPSPGRVKRQTLQQFQSTPSPRVRPSTSVGKDLLANSPTLQEVLVATGNDWESPSRFERTSQQKGERAPRASGGGGKAPQAAAAAAAPRASGGGKPKTGLISQIGAFLSKKTK